MNTFNNQLLIKIAEAFATGNLQFAAPHLAENIRWNILGEPTVTGKAQVLELSRMSQLQSFPVITIKNIIAEKNFVVIESTGQAKTAGGQPYHQAYCEIFRFDNEQLQEITTYLDTAASRTVGDTAPATAIIRQLYDRINRNEIDAVLNLMDSNILRHEFEGTPRGGTYHGLAEMRQHLVAARSTWAEGACEPVDFFSAPGKIVVAVRVKVRLKNATAWIDGWVTDGFIMQNNLVAEFHSFADKQKAFEWAGITPGID